MTVDQLDIFNQPAPFVAGSATSHGAAVQIAPDAPNLREQVFAAIAHSGPLTDESGASLLKMNPSTYRPRRIELARMGRIEPDASPQLTAAGRKAVAWRVCTSNEQGF